MVEQAFFQFGTNAAEVASEVTRELNRISAAVQRTRGAMSTGGATQASFLQGFQQQIAQARMAAERQIQQLGATFQQSMRQAQAQGQTWQRPTAATFAGGGREIGVNLSRELQRISEQHLRMIPEGVDTEGFRQVAAEGSRSVLQQFEGLYGEQAQAVNELARETTRRTRDVAGQLQIPVERTAREIQGIQPQAGVQAAQEQMAQAQQQMARTTDPQSIQRLRRGYVAAQRTLSQQLADRLEANATEAGGVRDPQGTRMVGSRIYDQGQFYRMQRQEGALRATPLQPGVDDPELHQAQQARRRAIEADAERERKAAAQQERQTQKEEDARGRRIRQQEQAWAQHEAPEERQQGRRAAEEDRAWSQREQAQRQHARQVTQSANEERAVRQREMEGIRRRNAELERVHQQEMATRLRAMQARGEATQVRGTQGDITTARPGQDPMQAQIHRIDQHGRAHQLMGEQLHRSRIRLASQFQQLEQETAQAAQAMRTQAARSLRGVPGGGGGRGGGGTAGGMGGPIGGGGGDGIFTEEGLFGHGQRYARYSVVAAAIFGVQAAIRDTWQEAELLAEASTDLEVAIGRNQQVSREWQNELQEIARVAGTNVAQAMETAARGVRAFTDVQEQSEAANEEAGTAVAHAAERLSVIADKDVESATGDIIAVGTSYGLVAGQLDRVNEGIANAKRLGGFPAEVAQGASNAAQAFQQAGFTIEELTSSIGVVQARLDQSGQTTATRLARVFQETRGGGAQATLSELGIDTSGAVRDQIDALADLVAAGELSERQLNTVVEQLAGTFASREFLALLQNWEAVQGNVTEAILEGGRATDEFNRRVENLAGLLRRIQGSLAGIQTGLIEAGAFNSIGIALEGIEPSLRLLQELLTVFNQLPEPLRQGLSLLGQYTIAVRALARFNAARMVEQGAQTDLIGQRAMGPGLTERARARGAAVALRREPEAARAAGITPQMAQRGRAAQQANTAAQQANTAARQANVGASRMQQTQSGLWVSATAREQAAATAATASTRTRTQALREQAVAYRQRAAAAAASVRRDPGGAAQRGISRGRGLASAVAGSGIGRVVGGMAAISAVMSVVDSFQAVEQASRSAAQALEDVRAAIDPDDFDAAAQQFSTAASETRDAATGFSGFVQGAWGDFAGGGNALGYQQGGRRTEGGWGWLGEAIGSGLRGVIGSPELALDLFGAGPENLLDEERALEDAAIRAADLAGAMRDAEAAAAEARQAGVFGWRLGTVEDLEAGLEALDQRALTAAEQIDVLFEALGAYQEFSNESGVIMAGGGRQLAAAATEALFGEMREAFAAEEREDWDIDFDAGVIDDAQALKAAKDAEDSGRRLRELRQQWADDIEADGVDEAEARRRAGERYREASEAVTHEQAERREALRDVEDMLPDEAATIDIQEMVAGQVLQAIEAAGIGEGGQLDPAELQQLATDIVDTAIANSEGDARSEMEDKRGDIIEEMEDALQGLTDFAEMPNELVNELSRRIPDMAEAEAGEIQILERDPVAAANAQVERIQWWIDMLEEAGREVPDMVLLALAEAQQAADEAIDTRLTLYNELAKSLLAESDVAGRNERDLRDVTRRLNEAREAGDKEEAMRLETERNNLRRDAAQDELNREASVRDLGAGADPVAQAAAELENAQAARDDIKKYDSAGNVSEDWAEAQLEVQESQRALTRAEADRANLIAESEIDPRDDLGQARQALAHAENLLAEEAALLAQGIGDPDEYYRLLALIQDLKIDQARTALDAAQAQRSAGIDPRDDVGRAAHDLQSAREDLEQELPGTEAFYNAQERINEAQQDLAREQQAQSAALRGMGINPADEVGQAANDLQTAQEELALALPGTEEYGNAYQQVAEAQRDLASAQRDLASAQRQANVFPGAQLAQAQADLADAEAELRDAVGGTQEYYEALGNYREAQWELSEAMADRQHVQRMLNLDITDDVVVAKEELRQARERMQRLQAAGAPAELLDEQRLEVREQEASAEMTAFQRRMRDAQTAQELGRMSHRAYLSYLNEEADRLRAISDRTRQQQEMLNEVDRAIQSASSQLEGQWNIGEITIPTPFEVRRVLEAESQGMGLEEAVRPELVNLDTGTEELERWRRALQGTSTELNEGSTSLRDHSEASEGDRETTLGAVAATDMHANAMTLSGAATRDTSVATRAHSVNLRSLMEQAGLSEGAIRSYIEELNLTPAEIETVVKIDIEPAREAVLEFQDWLNEQREITLTTGVGDGPGAHSGGGGGGGGAINLHSGPGGGGHALSRVRQVLPPNLTITSTYRTPEENRLVGGAEDSFHMNRENPAVDIGGPVGALDEFAARLRQMGGWRELLWRVGGHFDHIHVAHQGGDVTNRGIEPLRHDEVLSKLQSGETVLPRGFNGGSGTTYNETKVEVNGADLVEVKTLLKQLLGPGAMSRTSAMSGRRV